MTADVQALFERLRSFTIDAGGPALPFHRRLARENAWRPVFALRVVDEYKRFLILAIKSGHPVTPSDAVDQAWHLHLLYTRSYWDDLCRGVLGAPLHHEPTAGGAQEAGKFHDWYMRTLDSYTRIFGTAPPRDIWPAPDRRFASVHFSRVDRGRYFVLPKLWRRR